MGHKATVVLDWDGTCTADPHYDPRRKLADLDLDGIRLARRLGHPVAVMTCGVVSDICALLEAAGFATYADHGMQHWAWHETRRVLVTNRKVSGVIFDDRANRHEYGWDWTASFELAGLVAAS